MATLQIPNRPFASEMITGLALPDGIFEIVFGRQVINAHVKSAGNAPVTNTDIYIESTSDPGISIIASTLHIANLSAGASRVMSWQADFTKASPGKKLLSFVYRDANGVKKRIIKQIFVTRTSYDASTNSVSIETPEGVLKAGFPSLVTPWQLNCDGGRGPCCCDGKAAPVARPLASTFNRDVNLLQQILESALYNKQPLCPTWYLPQEVSMIWVPNPPYPGQYGDLPFHDPWWKVLLCILAVILLIAASIVSGGGITLGNGDPSGEGKAGSGSNCCGLSAGGSTSSGVAAGLVAAAAACVVAAGMSDIRDPMRRGQDNTPPSAGEVTVFEFVKGRFTYPEPVVLGKPFAVGFDWTYKRQTNVREYDFSASDVTQNVHVLTRYTIDAPNLVHAYKEDPWIIKAQFWDKAGELLVGDELFVQCFLLGPAGQVVKLVLQDDGFPPDAAPNDGVYTGIHYFNPREEGLWKYLVIAQDVNNANPDMSPEQAAQIIGGMVLTNQLTISFEGGTCKLVPDGFVNVIGT